MRLVIRAVVVLLVSGVAARLVAGLLVKATSRVSFVRQLTEQLQKPISWIVPLVALQMVLRAAADDLPLLGPARHLTALLIIALMTWAATRVVRAVEKFLLLRHPVDVADNLRARRIQTQTRVLVRTMNLFLVFFGVAAMLTTFPGAKQIGTGLMASAGVAGLAIGFAAKPVLGNLIAGIQIAMTQPIRLDDVVVVEGEWGRIEEITGTYVVVRIWDERRLIVPLQYFIEQPFQNWTRQTSSILGSVFLWTDYSLPLEPLKQELARLCEAVPEMWDGRVQVLQVTDATDKVIQLRALASSRNSSLNWDLRCYLREQLIAYINREHPECLPRTRATISNATTHVSGEQI
ncbi:Mechanosensitive ion channel [Halopseudomonas sabulinigri]|uniref:Mechanosensitive ion channel n=1 Tax=Halopseudomonas sabulinigri TaxID=472181 RepID=A0A1H1PD86_9GAMM|nr:mechanosensitive ion channel family protein [Halopseudomonas sabulinigri]SDS09087.1 Mechanosensitive ion channel [Halopseudomonas sabulinigri]